MLCACICTEPVEVDRSAASARARSLKLACEVPIVAVTPACVLPPFGVCSSVQSLPSCAKKVRSSAAKRPAFASRLWPPMRPHTPSRLPGCRFSTL